MCNLQLHPGFVGPAEAARRPRRNSQLKLTRPCPSRMFPPASGTSLSGRNPVTWRKWLVRILVFAAVGSAGAGYVVYQRATNDVTVRELVLGKLGEEIPGAAATLETAHLRLLGGIAITD